jgi:hypothetical protein
MCRQACIWLLVAGLLLPALSCTRLPQKAAPAGPLVGSEQLPATDAIPPEWGKLVSVTTNPAYPGWFQLWFEDDSSTVRMAAFDFRNKKLDPDAVVIPRR